MSCTNEDLSALTADLEKINYSVADLTQENLQGAGIFDVLMRALENHLEREHTANRITGDQYATAYTQLTSVVLQQSIQFILGLGKLQLDNSLTVLQNEKLVKEIQLLCQKLVTEKAQVMDHTILDPTATPAESYTNPETNESYANTVQLVTGTTGRRNNVLSRQEKGYDDDYKTKTARNILDSYRTLAANQVPTSIPSLTDGAIDYLMKSTKMDSGIQPVDNTDYLGDLDDQRAGYDPIYGEEYYWRLDIPE